MTDYTPNRLILDEIAANHKWMMEIMDGMPTECLTSCAEEIKSLRAKLVKRTEERNEARRMYCKYGLPPYKTKEVWANTLGWDCYKEKSK